MPCITGIIGAVSTAVSDDADDAEVGELMSPLC
jgi:hypothetical protein